MQTAFDAFLQSLGFQDKELSCKDCGAPFVFTASEQSFFDKKGLVNEPKRCPNCRVVHRAKRKGDEAPQFSDLNCADCHAMTRVPFHPRKGEPVYCQRCFHERREAQPELQHA